MISNISEAENRPFDIIKNRPIEQLVRHLQKKRISNKELEDLSLEKHRTNGRGITFSDVIEEYRCSKRKAQRKLKNARIEKIDKNGKKKSILFTLDNERTKPQQYFPSCRKAEIIENKRNRPIDPKGLAILTRHLTIHYIMLLNNK